MYIFIIYIIKSIKSIKSIKIYKTQKLKTSPKISKQDSQKQPPQLLDHPSAELSATL